MDWVCAKYTAIIISLSDSRDHSEIIQIPLRHKPLAKYTRKLLTNKNPLSPEQ